MTTLARSLVLDQGGRRSSGGRSSRSPSASPNGRSLVAWLHGVVKPRAQDHRLGGARVAAARGRRASTSADVVERAEMHRLVVDRVLALPEPYREAVLLRYFEDLSAAEVAQRQDVPLATARTRLQRGLERLRGELDRFHAGERRVWLTAILPLAGLEAATWMRGTTAVSAAEAHAGAAAWQSVAGSAQSGVQGLVLGGAIMTQNTAITVVVATVAALVLGGVVGRFTSRINREEAKSQFGLVEESKLSDLETSSRSPRPRSGRRKRRSRISKGKMASPRGRA
jgi:hypothetical protein